MVKMHSDGPPPNPPPRGGRAQESSPPPSWGRAGWGGHAAKAKADHGRPLSHAGQTNRTGAAGPAGRGSGLAGRGGNARLIGSMILVEIPSDRASRRAVSLSRSAGASPSRDAGRPLPLSLNELDRQTD